MSRHFSPQPNVPGQGILASYRPRFWVVVVAIGIAAGLGGAALMELLRVVQHLGWAYRSGTFLDAVTRASAARHLLILLAAGVLTALGVALIRRMSGSGAGEISQALWLQNSRLSFWPTQARALLSIVIVSLGASLGREAAPQLTGAAVASSLSDRARLPAWQRQLLVACGAGAGMAAVYNVPLGGALFAVEVLLGTLALPFVLPALATSLIATAVAWVVLSDRPIYQIPTYGVSASQLALAALIGPIAGLAAVAWVRLIARVNSLRPSGRWRPFAPVVVFIGLGGVSIAYPQLLGNGQDVVQLAFTAHLAVALLAVALVLKPLVTAACLGSGAPGGLFTPTLAYGALLGGLMGHGWVAIWPGAPVGSFALIAGAAVLAASTQGPLAAVVLILELTRHTDALMVPILLAVTEATILARLLGAPSIYSARLDDARARGREEGGTQPLAARVARAPPGSPGA